MEKYYAHQSYIESIAHTHRYRPIYMATEVDARIAALQAQHAEAMAEKDQRIEAAEAICRCAEHYILNFYPQTHDEEQARATLLLDINALIPPPAPQDLCGGGDFCCVRPAGHEGAHDEIPF